MIFFNFVVLLNMKKMKRINVKIIMKNLVYFVGFVRSVFVISVYFGEECMVDIFLNFW